MPKIDREKVLSRLPSLVRFRLTSQRLLLLSLIEETEGRLDVYDIYRRAKEKEPKLSLSTVYRALRLFKELGIVDDLHYEEHHYHALKLPREHYHLVCLGCGYVLEFEVARAEVNLSGLCGRCR